MKVYIVILSVALAVQAATIDNEWIQFKKNHGKTYRSTLDEQKHFKTFQENLKKISEHNKKYDAGETTWHMAINQFTDMTYDEFSKYNHLAPFVEPKLKNVTIFKSKLQDAPGIFDWRDRGGINDVKNQGGCGSCWAFAAIGALESRYFIVHGQQRISLSEQQLVDCSRGYGSNGCSGGWMTQGYDYIRDNDINRDGDYPYAAADQNCRADGNRNVNIGLSGYYQTQQDDEENMRFAVYEHGALAVAICVTDNFQHYGGGIFNDPSCNSDSLNHGVTIVGYGREGDTDFWAVRNSWGGGWGEGGYIRMIRKNNGHCGIAKFGYSPDIRG